MTAEQFRQSALRCLVVAALPLLVHGLAVAPAEPVFDGDSNRHVMTSIFFRDFLADGEYLDPKGYAEAYFEQYPALGLLVWPPLFHGVCGVVMLCCGTSATVARVLIAVCLLLATRCVYQLARRAVDEQRALLTAIVFAILPLVFRYSRDVMLEMPTLALVLLSAEQFDLWLRSQRQRCLYVAAVSAALAALTRFDAAVLLPFYLIMLTLHRAWGRMKSVHVVAAAVIAICLVAPVYLLIAREMGALHLRQAAESVGGSVDGSRNGFLQARNFWFYPSVLVEQAGWPVTVCCVAGLLGVLLRRAGSQSAAFLALLLATYLTFSPLAELRSRHAIYWLPAVAYFAVLTAAGVAQYIARWIRPQWSAALTGGVYAVLLTTTAAGTLQEPAFRVEGYREAAAWLLQRSHAGDRVFFDGWWDGNFTYHMRHLDPSRSRHVIRGDRLLYDFVCVPSTDFQQHVESDREILQALLDAEIRFVVLENPQFYEQIAVAQQLRTLVHAQPELFVPERSIFVKSSLEHLPWFRLEIYRFSQDHVRQWLQSSHAMETFSAKDPT